MMKPQINNNYPNVFWSWKVLSTCFFIYLFTSTIYFYFDINLDVSWLVEASQRLITGGTYHDNFFENNPPWILYLYAPVAYLNLLGVNINLSLILYTFTLVSVSLCFCANYSKVIFANDSQGLLRLVLILLLFCFLILPANSFAQREHLFVVLSMPYFLLISARLGGGKYSFSCTFITGLIAGCGFLIKPFFLLSFLFVEIYFYVKKAFRFRLRPETAAVVALTFLYGLLLLFFHRDYLLEVLPEALTYCNSKIGDHLPWQVVILENLSLACIAIFLLIQFDSLNINHYFFSILKIVLISVFCSYLLQRMILFYHVLPAFSVAIILFGFYFYAKKNDTAEEISYFSTAARIIIAGVFIRLYLPDLAKLFNSLDPYLLVSVISLSVIIYSVKKYIHLSQRMLIAKTGLLFLSVHFVVLICVLLLNCYSVFIADKAHCNKLTSFINQYAKNQSILFFTTDLYVAYPIISYSNARSASRYSYFWSLAGMVKKQYTASNENEKSQLNADKNNFIARVVEDIKKNKPKLILIDRVPNKEHFYLFNDKHPRNVDFNYEEYFLSNIHFKEVWENYRYLTTLTEMNQSEVSSKLDVYELIS